jgi:hypothetical protein
MSALSIVFCGFFLSVGQPEPPFNAPGSFNPTSPNRSTSDPVPKVEKPLISNEITKRYVSPTEGQVELLAPLKEIIDKRVRLVPEVRIESTPQYFQGKSEFGTTRQDVQIHYRKEKQTITSMKLRTVERQVQVLSRRTILKGEIDPTTGEKATECRQVTVPVSVTMSCQVLEPVTEEIIVQIPEAKTVESPIVVRRYGLLTGEKGEVSKRYRAVLFDDPIPIPPCLEDFSPRDPLGRPESPDDPGGQNRQPLPSGSSEFPQPLPTRVLPKPPG